MRKSGIKHVFATLFCILIFGSMLLILAACGGSSTPGSTPVSPSGGSSTPVSPGGY
jgi:hypothetical protein